MAVVEALEGDQWTIIVRGNWGQLVVSAWTGAILEVHPAEGDDRFEEDIGYPGIARFDVMEYLDHYGVIEDTDILDIGYWTHSGLYEPPEPDFRKRVSIECPHLVNRH